MLTAGIALIVGAVAYVAGRRHGRAALWGRMVADKQTGHRALEALALTHGAKIELVELP